jgi:hypothetical protein
MDSMSSTPTREALISLSADGHFRLVRTADAHQLTPIVFNSRKAARNWAFGRGYQVREGSSPGGR